MEPEQNQPSMPNFSPNNQGAPRQRWILIASIAAVVIIIAVILVALSMNTRKPASEKAVEQTIKPLTVGTKAYLYPCSVATQADYARIFGLDNTGNVGTITESSAFAPKQLKEGGDLAKLAPSSTSQLRYTTDCSHTLPKKDRNHVDTIDIALVQTDSDEAAKKSFESARASAASDYTSDGIDNGKRQLSTLPSFGTNSFVRLPDADSILRTVEATFLDGSRTVELSYSLEATETVEAITALIDAYAGAIKTNMQKSGTSKPLDLTGRETFVGQKLVDLCQRVDFKKLSTMLDDIEFRPDQISNINIYGALAGSRSAEDGAVSNCGLKFNNKANRDAQQAMQRQSSLSVNMRWPHNMIVAVNSFATPAAAKAAHAGKKSRAAQPFAGVTPTIKDISGIGDVAYSYHKESTLDSIYNGEKTQNKTFDESLVVVKGSDMITVNLQQTSQQVAYEITPMTVSQTQFKDVYQLVLDTVTQNRR